MRVAFDDNDKVFLYHRESGFTVTLSKEETIDLVEKLRGLCASRGWSSTSAISDEAFEEYRLKILQEERDLKLLDNIEI